MGKSPEEIEEMRRRKLEKQGFDRKKGAVMGDEEAGPGLGPISPSLPASEDKLLPPAGGIKGKQGKAPKGPGKKIRIKCPKCDKIQTVTTTKRPIEFLCTNCGMKLVLKK